MNEFPSVNRIGFLLLDSSTIQVLQSIVVFRSDDYDYGAAIMVYMASRLNHDNVVEMLGYCADGGSRLLAYEYASNGMLFNAKSESLNNLLCKSLLFFR
ncbi:putative non-specific serine/threonine protein kinase [Helianthus anomalus]